MEFKISPHIIASKKRSPYLVFVCISFLAGLLAMLTYSSDFDWTQFTIIFGVTAIVSTRGNYKGTRDYIKYANTHKILILPKGMVSYEGDFESLMLWDKIIKVSIKSNSKGIKKIILKTMSSDTVDLSHYENLDVLNMQLKKYLDPQIWH